MKGSTEFQSAVSKLFQHWDVLHHAVDSQFGGSHSREKAEWIPSVVVDFFMKNKDLDPTELETFIGEIMDNEFDLLVEDGSLKKLSKQLCRCYGWARDERFQELKDFLTTLQPLPPPRAKAVENEDASEDEDDEESKEKDNESKTGGDEPMEGVEEESSSDNRRISKPKNEPIVDEDGFTLVVGKKKH